MDHARFCKAIFLPFYCALVFTACATQSQDSTPAKEADAMPTIAAHPDQAQPDQMSALKQAIDEIAAADFADIQFLDRYLSTDLSAQQREEPSNPRLLIRSSEKGRFAGISVRKVELITWKGGDPSLGRLVIELAEPGPSAEAFASTYWVDAEFSPGRPHAPGSPSVWTTKQGKGIVSIYHTQDDPRIVRIGFGHEP